MRNNRLLPIKSYIQSQSNSRDNSSEKSPLHNSLNKYQSNELVNPYLKKFNLRKLNRTEESVKKRTQKSQPTRHNEQANNQLKEKISSSLQKNKNRKLNSIRINTQKIRNKTTEVLKGSPYLNRQSQMQTIDHQLIQNQNKYQNLTTFQRDEIHRYEVYFIGKRRINSNKDFTDKNGDAKIAAQDSIIYRYEILDILGKGSFGQVFKAFDHKRKELCALKIIRDQPKFCTQAKVQIKILEQVLIKDPKMKSNIIQMKHAFFFRGHPCLVFQLLHNNLYEFLRQFKFSGVSLDLILRFTIQILQGLLFLKKFNIIHCDLKPQNILLKQKNKTGIKIIDVGSGCYEQEQIYTYIQSRFYRAPEIIFGIPYTCAIDIWSLGCILVQLHQGFPLFPGEDEMEQIAMFMEIFGIPPVELIQKGCRSKKFFLDFKPKIKPNKKGVIRKPGSKSVKQVLKTQNSDFLDFLTKCFVWEPEKRMTPSDALLHPWVIKGIPQEIRKQHIHQVQKNSQV